LAPAIAGTTAATAKGLLATKQAAAPALTPATASKQSHFKGIRILPPGSIAKLRINCCEVEMGFGHFRGKVGLAENIK
jgi:hypothetical protein